MGTELTLSLPAASVYHIEYRGGKNDYDMLNEIEKTYGLENLFWDGGRSASSDDILIRRSNPPRVKHRRTGRVYVLHFVVKNGERTISAEWVGFER